MVKLLKRMSKIIMYKIFVSIETKIKGMLIGDLWTKNKQYSTGHARSFTPGSSPPPPPTPDLCNIVFIVFITLIYSCLGHVIYCITNNSHWKSGTNWKHLSLILHKTSSKVITNMYFFIKKQHSININHN